MNTYASLHALMSQSETIDFDAYLHVFPALRELEKTPQDPIHHAEGDVWTHTKMVCQEIIRKDSYWYKNKEQQFILFYAALFHDIAKPLCTRVQNDGRVTAAGHSSKGAVDARVLLWRANVPFHVRERICQIIAFHQYPFYLINGTRDNLSPEFLVRKLSWILRVDELCDVAEADLRGRKCADFEDTLLNIELARELAKEDDCLYEARHFPDDFTRMYYFRTNGNCSPDHALFPTFSSNVYVMCGLPASGKNSWVKKYVNDLPVVSFDDAKEELGLKHGENDGKAAHLVIDTAKEYLRRKQDFVWNSTNLSKQMREKTLNLLYDYKAKVTIVYVEQPEDIIKSRNNKRDTTLTNEKIESMLYRWEVPTPFEAHGFEIVLL